MAKGNHVVPSLQWSQGPVSLLDAEAVASNGLPIGEVFQSALRTWREGIAAWLESLIMNLAIEYLFIDPFLWVLCEGFSLFVRCSAGGFSMIPRACGGASEVPYSEEWIPFRRRGTGGSTIRFDRRCSLRPRCLHWPSSLHVQAAAPPSASTGHPRRRPGLKR